MPHWEGKTQFFKILVKLWKFKYPLANLVIKLKLKYMYMALHAYWIYWPEKLKILRAAFVMSAYCLKFTSPYISLSSFIIIYETDTIKCYLRLIQSVSTSQTQPPGKGCVILKQSSSVRGVIPSNTAWEIVTILPTPAASM